MADIQAQPAAQTSAPVEGVVATETAANKPAETQAVSPQIIAMAKKEKWLRKMQQDLKTEREALQGKATQYEKDYIPKAKLLENPWAVLQESGLTIEQLIQQAQNQPSPQELEMKRIQAEIQSIKDQSAQSTKQQYDQALKQIKNDVTTLVNQEAERFEIIKTYGLEDNVVQEIEKHFKETGTVLDLAEATAKIENELFEEMKKAVSLSKMKGLFAPKEAELASTETTAPAQSLQDAVKRAKSQIVPREQSPTIKTLTNAKTVVSVGPQSQRDRIERAKLAFRGLLQP